jgi:hypothetical protein|tara:strand:+ start:20079 stop:21965 length:1887 start_codon:yes stop_codon:yes gene_type:complete
LAFTLRFLLFIILIACFFQNFGQIELKNLNIDPFDHSMARTSSNDSMIVLTLPFWDDFSQSRGIPDSTLWESGVNVFINNSLGINPPSQYVATFDGTDVLGNAYATNNSFNGAADSLVSRPIDISQIAPSKRNNVYLSFYWQLLGKGEIPELTDSLSLMFWSIDSTWITQDLFPDDPAKFSIIGGLENILLDADSLPMFQQLIIRVAGNQYFHENFKMKFQSFSSLNGIYDTWNLDYIYLNDHRTVNEITYQDRTLSSQPSLLFEPYFELPANQYLAHPEFYEIPQFTTANNLFELPSPMEYTHTLSNLVNGQMITTGSMALFRMSALESKRRVDGLSMDASLVDSDSVLIESTFVYKSGDKNLFEEVSANGDTIFSNINLRDNDTIRQTYLLHDYFAYDDGVADFSAGINFLSGQLAVRFIVNEPDTLTGIKINFPAISPSTSGKALEIRVWTDLSNEGLIYAKSYQIANTDRIHFNLIEFTQSVFVRDTIYIGFKQFTEDYIGVGFDKDNANGMSSIFFNTSSKWEQNTRLPGSLMMRAVFGKNKNLVLGNPLDDQAVLVFPNPSDGLVQINGRYKQYTLYNMTGKQLEEGGFSVDLDFSKYAPGTYLLRLIQQNIISTHKIIIEK